MPPVEFDPTVSAGERPQTYALERAPTGTDTIKQIRYNNKYDTAILNKVSRTNDEHEHKEGKTQTRRAKFTYVGRHQIYH
jgi:NADPH-dependent 7-cyano-7-deazaguanine reductase QueF-like protein